MVDSKLIKAILFAFLIGGLIVSAVPDLMGGQSRIGWLVLGLLVTNLSYVLFKQSPDVFPTWVRKKDMYVIHRWSGIAIAPITVVHLVTIGKDSLFLWLPVGLIIFVSVTGYSLSTNRFPSTYKHSLYQIHTLHPLVLVITGSLITAHLLVL